MSKTILITGAAGFIGRHFVKLVHEQTDWNIITTDGLNYATDIPRLRKMIPGFDDGRISIFYHDLRAPLDPLLRQIPHKRGPLAGRRIDYIVNIASESHVDRSIDTPVPFIRNNVDLILNMLEFARRVEPEKFLHISTDEVYGPATEDHLHKEWEPILPSNPYSASKAAQEAIAFSYWRTYGVPLIITNTMNNFGCGQNDEKFVPLVVRSLINGEEISIHGSWETQNVFTPPQFGASWVSGTRVWLHATCHAEALLELVLKKTPTMFPCKEGRPDRYHIAGQERIANEKIVTMAGEILHIVPKFKRTDFHSSRPGHDLHYSLDGAKLHRELDFKFSMDFETSFQETVLSIADSFSDA